MSMISELELGLSFTARRVTVLLLSAAAVVAGCSGGGDAASGAAGGSASGDVASCEIVQGSVHYCEETRGSGATIAGCSKGTTGFLPGMGCPRDSVSGSCEQGAYTFYVYEDSARSIANFCSGATSGSGGGGTSGSGGGGAVGGGGTNGSGGSGAVGGGATSGSGGGSAVGGGPISTGGTSSSEAKIACYIPQHGNFTGTSCTADYYTASSCEALEGMVFDTCPQSDGFEGCCHWIGADAMARGTEQCFYDAPTSHSGICGGTNGIWTDTP